MLSRRQTIKKYSIRMKIDKTSNTKDRKQVKKLIQDDCIHQLKCSLHESFVDISGASHHYFPTAKLLSLSSNPEMAR
jgi:hypothetical protein